MIYVRTVSQPVVHPVSFEPYIRVEADVQLRATDDPEMVGRKVIEAMQKKMTALGFA